MELLSRRVYVWQMPVRFYHWVNAICILALSITGYLIGSPVAFVIPAEASFSYWFGTVRFIHFATAFIFFFNFIFRIYWGFVGDKYSHWYNFIPLKKSQWAEIVQVLKIDILHIKGKPIESIGHNALASLTYFITFLIFLFQSLTGFALYSDMSRSFVAKFFSAFTPFFGNDLGLRQVHHILMWGFLIFAMVHVYLVFYHDYVEKRGVTSSMIGGWKFIEKEEKE